MRVRKWTLLVFSPGELRRYVAADSKPFYYRANDLPWSPARVPSAKVVHVSDTISCSRCSSPCAAAHVFEVDMS